MGGEGFLFLFEDLEVKQSPVPHLIIAVQQTPGKVDEREEVGGRR